MNACKHCGTPIPAFNIDGSTIQRVAIVLADGSSTKAVDEVRAIMDCSDSEAQLWVDHFAACCKSWPFKDDDISILRQIDEAFAFIEKPIHFTDYVHCDECKEHDDTLCARTRETLRRQDLGNPGWDPLNFTTEEGIGYLFPTLARFAFMPEGHGQYGWYGDQLIWHLSYETTKNRFLTWCNAEQRLAVIALLEHISKTRQKLVSDNFCENELSSAIAVWSSALEEQPS